MWFIPIKIASPKRNERLREVVGLFHVFDSSKQDSNATTWTILTKPSPTGSASRHARQCTIEPLLDRVNAKFDSLTFMWLGSLNAEISTCAFWSPDLKTLVDLRHREVVVGSTGPSSGSTVDARVLGPLTGINFKIVTSDPGLVEVRLAADRGEVDGHCGLQVSAIKSLLWDDFRAGRFSVPIQMKLRKHPDLPDVPNAYDFAASEEDRALFRLNFGPWSFGRPCWRRPARLRIGFRHSGRPLRIRSRIRSSWPMPWRQRRNDRKCGYRRF